jgi:hypothetical protein
MAEQKHNGTDGKEPPYVWEQEELLQPPKQKVEEAEKQVPGFLIFEEDDLVVNLQTNPACLHKKAANVGCSQTTG